MLPSVPRLVLLLLCALISLAPATSHAQTGQPSTLAYINPNMCSIPHQVAYNTGRQLLLANELAKDEQYFRYKVSAMYAANCVNQFVDYLRTIDRAVSRITTVAASTSVISAAVTLLAIEVMEQVMDQLLTAMNNQVCQITNEAMGAIDSVVQNAICLPTIGGGLGRIGFNVNLNLGRTQCNGWAINPAGIFADAAPDPTNDPSGNTAFEAPVVSGQPIRGLGGVSYAADLPPSFRADLPDSAVGAYDYIQGEDPGQVVADVSLGSVGSGNSKLNIAAAIAALRRNALGASSGYCARFIRYALEAGGLNTVGHPDRASRYGPFLESRGFSQVPTGGYVPQAGDIAVMPPYPGGKPYGHIAMFDGSRWISDFAQKDMFGGPGYRNNGQVAIYRP